MELIQNQLHILEKGAIRPKGTFIWSSNNALLVDVDLEEQAVTAVYKPAELERPLWDFPAQSLAGREVAAFLVDQALGFSLVPPTFFRDDAPYGPGSIQLYIPHDPEFHYFTLPAEGKEVLQPVAFFDLVINNTDRKGGHLLFDSQQKLWLIDHGTCFHEDPKLRTVIWDFAGEPVPRNFVDKLPGYIESLIPGHIFWEKLIRFLSEDEIQAMQDRCLQIVTNPVFPSPKHRAVSYPWPLV
ncbi:MAG: hypothetical protein JXA19_03465 [Anaerolineales bacterium]|nr:hypothetical protein [Anaerolineales bacterium]